jgi:spore coat protein SA
MKKILIVSPDILPVPAVKGGAVETLIEQLINSHELSNSNDIHYTVTSITDGLIDYETKLKKTKYVYFRNDLITRKLSAILKRVIGLFGVNKYFGNLYLLKVCKYVRNKKFDYIIIQNNPEYGLILSKYTDSKMILHLHNDRLCSTAQNANAIADTYDSIFTVSEYVRSNVLTIPTINAHNVKVVYNCVDLSKYNKSQDCIDEFRAELINDYNLSLEGRIVTYVGRLDSTKGVLELIQAFNRLTDNNLSLLIVGASWFSKKSRNSFVLQLEKELENAVNPIVFTGYIEHDNIPLYQASSDILVVPSVSVDACPLVILESMAANTTLVTTDSGGIPELVPLDCGVLIERKNGGEHLVNELYRELSDLLEKSDSAKSLATNALSHVKSFDVNNYSEKFECAIKSVL